MRGMTRHRGRRGKDSAGAEPDTGTGGCRALARSPQVATPRRMCMTTPRAMTHEALRSQRPQGLRRSHAVAKGLDTALAMASGTEGKGAKGQQSDDDEGATEGKIAVKIARPPGRRPSKVLVVIGHEGSDRMMSKPPGRRPSQVMAVIMSTRGNPPMTSHGQMPEAAAR